MIFKPIINEGRCQKCNFCRTAVLCPGDEKCTACGACIDACPTRARELIEDKTEINTVSCEIDGQLIEVRERQTVLQVLESIGFSVTSFPRNDSIFAPCRTGGCYSCAVLIDGELKQSCITPVRKDMVIQTDVTKTPPKRIVSSFQGHSVGGVGTPKNITPISPLGYLEVACFASGCLYRCSTCQNWTITYLSKDKALTPEEAAHRLTLARNRYQVDRMAISGGESTLNRKWLLYFIKRLKELNPDKNTRIHVDTNAAILTSDYIDDLITQGMTDIGPDLKGINLETFMKISNLRDKKIASKYLTTSWNAVKYILDEYKDDVFLGVGIPYNSSFMSLDELAKIGNRLATWDPELQITVLDYRPEFRATYLQRPTFQEMMKVQDILTGIGLKRVICQTSKGYVK